jgi:transposase
MPENYLTSLLKIQGFCVEHVEHSFHKGQESVFLHLGRTNKSYSCGECGQAVEQGYDRSWQEVQHLMLWHYLCFLRFERFRVQCPRCGIRTEALDFVDVRGPRVTLRLAHLVAELCKIMTNTSVGVLQALHRGTVKEIDKRAMAKVQTERPLDGITVMGVDEIAVGKGQTYWTMLSAVEGPRGPELLNVVEGRREKSLKTFWKWFGKERARRVTHVVMDMWLPFQNSFKAHCPGIQIIYDKFHIIRHLLDALNDVRKSELSKAGKRFKGLLAGKKFILMSRMARVRGKAREALTDLLAASPKLLKAHLLKESFNHLWSYKSKTCARRFFQQWVDQLKWSRMTSYKKFAKSIEEHLDGILAFCDKKVSLGYVEATNLKAKNIIRRAYGFQDKAYMKLKIIQGCTPWMGQFRPWTVAHRSSS